MTAELLRHFRRLREKLCKIWVLSRAADNAQCLVIPLRHLRSFFRGSRCPDTVPGAQTHSGGCCVPLGSPQKEEFRECRVQSDLIPTCALCSCLSELLGCKAEILHQEQVLQRAGATETASFLYLCEIPVHCNAVITVLVMVVILCFHKLFLKVHFPTCKFLYEKIFERLFS